MTNKSRGILTKTNSTENSENRQYPLNPSNYDIHKQGYLIKSPPTKGGKRGTFLGITPKYRTRYFILHTNIQTNKTYLDYFANHEDLKIPKGSINLDNVKLLKYPIEIEDKQRLLIKTENERENREYYISSINNKEEDLLEWEKQIGQFIIT